MNIMENNTILTDEIFSSIDSINDIMMESEMNVLSSLIDSYDKAMMIMENYSGEDMESFSIFQEAEESAVQSGDPKSNNSADAKKGKNESFFKKALMFIPRLIGHLIAFLKKVWNNDIAPAIENGIDTIKDIPATTKDLFDEVTGKKDKEEMKKVLIASGISLGAAGICIGIINQYIGVNKSYIEAIGGWWEKVKAFFVKCTNRKPSLKMEWGKNICSTNINMKAVEAVLGAETKSILDQLAKLSPTASTEQIVNISKTAGEKITTIKDTEIILNEEHGYSFTEIPGLFKNINDHIKGITDSGSNAVKNLEQLLLKHTGKDGISPEATSAINKLLLELRNLTATIIPGTTTFIKSFGESFEKQTKLAEEFNKAMTNVENDNTDDDTHNADSDESKNEDANNVSETQESDNTPADDKNENTSSDSNGTESKEDKTENESTLTDTSDDKKAEVLKRYKAWREKNPEAAQNERNAARNKIAAELGLSKSQARKIIVEFTTLYGTLEFGDITYQESMVDTCYDTITSGHKSSGWYNR